MPYDTNTLFRVGHVICDLWTGLTDCNGKPVPAANLTLHQYRDHEPNFKFCEGIWGAETLSRLHDELTKAGFGPGGRFRVEVKEG